MWFSTTCNLVWYPAATARYVCVSSLSSSRGLCKRKSSALQRYRRLSSTDGEPGRGSTDVAEQSAWRGAFRLAMEGYRPLCCVASPLFASLLAGVLGCALWVTINFMYLQSLRVVAASVTTSVFSSCNIFVYMLSVAVLGEKVCRTHMRIDSIYVFKRVLDLINWGGGRHGRITRALKPRTDTDMNWVHSCTAL